MKICIALTNLILSLNYLVAQPQFTINDMPNLGHADSLLLKTGYTHSGNLSTETGKNYSWDFSDIKFDKMFWAVDSYRVKTHPISKKFKNADFEYFHKSSTVNHLELYHFKADTLFMHRMGPTTGGVSLTPAVGVMKLPINFGKQSVIKAPLYFKKTKSGERKSIAKYDGFGTLKLVDGKTYKNVFRITTIIKDSSYVSKSSVTYISYTWFKQGGEIPLLRITKTDVNNNVGKIYNLYIKGRVIKDPNTSINAVSLSEKIIIYPNPTHNGNFKLSFGQEEPTSLLVFKMDGTLVYRSTKEEIRSKSISANLPSGMYLVSLNGSQNQKRVFKLLVK